MKYYNIGWWDAESDTLLMLRSCDKMKEAREIIQSYIDVSDIDELDDYTEEYDEDVGMITITLGDYGEYYIFEEED